MGDRHSGILNAFYVINLLVVGKLWNHFHHKDNVRPAFDATFENFGLDYIDLYLIHFPFATQAVDPKSNFSFLHDKQLKLERSPLHETWKELEKLVDEGLVRNIGVSNYNVQTLLDLLSYARIKPAVLEIELHPYLQQRRLVDWARAQGIEIIAYASFGNAVFDKVPNSTAHLPNLLTHPVLKKIAEKHGRNTGQVALKFSAQNNIVVIPKSVQVERMKTNLDIFSFELDKEDLKELEELEANARFNDLTVENYGFELPLWA